MVSLVGADPGFREATAHPCVYLPSPRARGQSGHRKGVQWVACQRDMQVAEVPLDLWHKWVQIRGILVEVMVVGRWECDV